tara:strand:- start:2528 stop:2851 length:324 start_codon:yes stop_codon:yes gene_type:complete
MFADEYKRKFTFQIDARKSGGWVKFQLIKIFDEPTRILPNPAYYDPSIHCGSSGSYFNGRWPGRWSKNLNTYVLYGAFGNPGSRIPLDKIRLEEALKMEKNLIGKKP